MARNAASPALLSNTEFAWINKNIAKLYVLFDPNIPTYLHRTVVAHELVAGLYLIEEIYTEAHEADDVIDGAGETHEYYLWVKDLSALGINVNDLDVFDRRKFANK